MDTLLHLLDLLVTGIITSLCMLFLARVGLFPSVVLTYYVKNDEGDN